MDQEDNRIKEKIEELAAEAAEAAKVFLAVLVEKVDLLAAEAAAVMEVVVMDLKLVKVEAEDQEQDRPLVLVVEKVVLKDRLLIMVVILNIVEALVVPRALQSVNRVEYHLH
mgnify:CR=1 FL=1